MEEYWTFENCGEHIRQKKMDIKYFSIHSALFLSRSLVQMLKTGCQSYTVSNICSVTRSQFPKQEAVVAFYHSSFPPPSSFFFISSSAIHRTCCLTNFLIKFALKENMGSANRHWIWDKDELANFVIIENFFSLHRNAQAEYCEGLHDFYEKMRSLRSLNS